MRLKLAITIAVALVTVACASTQSGSSAAPIVGYWNWHDGVLQIKSVGSGSFEGSVAQLRTGQCIPALGHVILKIKGSGIHYTGGDEWYREGDCATQFSTNATVDLVGGNKTANLCSSGPFTDVPPVTSCLALQRIANYTPSPGG
jgi:hypothetical protein